MGLRFYRRVHLLPGVRLNFGTRSASVSFGVRGAWLTLGPHGRRTATLGWPGTGLRYTTTIPGKTTTGTGSAGPPPAPSALATALLLLGACAGVWVTWWLLTR